MTSSMKQFVAVLSVVLTFGANVGLQSATTNSDYTKKLEKYAESIVEKGQAFIRGEKWGMRNFASAREVFRRHATQQAVIKEVKLAISALITSANYLETCRSQQSQIGAQLVLQDDKEKLLNAIYRHKGQIVVTGTMEDPQLDPLYKHIEGLRQIRQETGLDDAAFIEKVRDRFLRLKGYAQFQNLDTIMYLAAEILDEIAFFNESPLLRQTLEAQIDDITTKVIGTVRDMKLDALTSNVRSYYDELEGVKQAQIQEVTRIRQEKERERAVAAAAEPQAVDPAPEDAPVEAEPAPDPVDDEPMPQDELERLLDEARKAGGLEKAQQRIESMRGPSAGSDRTMHGVALGTVVGLGLLYAYRKRLKKQYKNFLQWWRGKKENTSSDSTPAPQQ